MTSTAGALADLSLVFATAAGAAGFALSLVAYNQFRGSPFGRSLAVLPAFMLLLAVYHPILLVFPSHATVGLALESAAFALLAVFAGVSIRQHRRLNRQPRRGR